MTASPAVSIRAATLVVACAALAVLGVQRAAAQQRQPFTTEDALNVASLSVGDITPDGGHVAGLRWTQRDRKNVDHMRFGDPTYVAPRLAEVWVIDTESGRHASLFNEPVHARSLAWSPDGRTLAFFVREDDEFSLHVYDRERDRLRKVDLRTDKPIAANSILHWRPDGTGILLNLRAETWAEQGRRMFLDLTVGPTIVQDSREPFLAWDEVRNHAALTIPALVDVESREVRELFGEVRVSGLRQSEDGTTLSFVQTTPVRTSYTREGGATYQMVAFDLQTGDRSVLRDDSTTRISPRWNDAGDTFAFGKAGNVFVQSPGDSVARNLTEDHRAPVSASDSTRLRFSVLHWRPDGGMLLVESQRGYHLLDPATGDLELAYAYEGEEDTRPRLDVIEWSDDGRNLFVTYSARNRWERGLLRYDLETRRMVDLVRDANLYGGWRFSDDGSRVIYNRSDGDRPNDLFVADADFSESRRLTELNPWLDSRLMTRSELVEYLDADGETLYGVLYYPVNYEPGRRYPLVAEIYEEFFNNGFNHRMNLLANAGFFGFRPSADLELGFPGEGWLKGVTAGINQLIERGLVDKDRLGVHGTSYGGYATNLLITQTDRFAAAINISGKVNIISFLGDSPKITTRNYRAAENGQDRIGATLWEQPQKYLAHSAILSADRITTPLLMLTGEGDWNVPATNQREMYYALRRLDKEVVWVHYMNAGHGAGRSSTVEDFQDHWDRIISWYREHFAARDTAAATSDGSANP